MKILLINPSTDIGNIGLFPSGLAYITKAISRAGRDVDVWDFNAIRPSWDIIEKRIIESDYDFIGIGGLIIVYDYVEKLVRLIKKYHPKTIIVVGDSLGSSVPDLVLKKIGTDFVCVGEAETTIINLINALEKKEDILKVKGIAYKKNNEIIFNEPQDLQQDLDLYGMPDFEKFPVDLYLKNPMYNFAKRYDTPLVLPKKQYYLVAHRGCPYDCNFCYQIFGRKIRYRSVKNIIEEVIYVHEKFNVDFVAFGVDLFLANRKYIYEFCEEYKKAGLHKKIKWSTAGRANLMDKDLLTVLKDAGCVLVSYGFESGSPKILDVINKKTTIKQMEDSIKFTRDAGINMTYSFMIGQPGETKETIGESVAFIKRNNLYVHRFFFATPYPGTELYRYAENKGLIQDKEHFVRELQSATKFLINLTDLTNEELFKYYREAEKQVRSHYKRKFPSVYVKKKIKQVFKLNRKIEFGLQEYREKCFPEWVK